MRGSICGAQPGGAGTPQLEFRDENRTSSGRLGLSHPDRFGVWLSRHWCSVLDRDDSARINGRARLQSRGLYRFDM